jgi:signal transduction histidine kinase
MWILAISFFAISVLGLYSSIYHKIKGAKVFGLCMVFLGCWTISFGMETLGADFYTKHFWANLLYCFYVMIHILWFAMVLLFSGINKRTRGAIFLIFILIPVITIPLIWVNNWNGIIFYGFQIDSGVNISVAGKQFASLYLLNPIVTYSMDAAAIVLVIKRTLFFKTIYGMRTKAFMISPIISICPTLLYLMSFWIIKGYDIVGVLMGLAVILTALGGYYLFVAAPVARETAVDNMNIAMLVANGAGTVADANVAAITLLGKKKKAILGAQMADVLRDLGLDESELLSAGAIEFETEHSKSNGKIFYRIQKLPIISKRGVHAGSIVLIYDITQMRLEGDRQMQQSSKDAASRERERFARDLHDNLAQILASISLQAQGISHELKNEEMEKIDRDITRLVSISQSAHREVREYIRYVRDPNADEKDIAQVVMKVFQEFESQALVHARLETEKLEELDRLSSDQKSNFVFIFQEALNNIRKHSKAHNATIRIYATETAVSVIIADDGIGFTTTAYRSEQFGLKIMKERAIDMDAQIEIQSEIGKGTTISLVIPFPNGERCGNA